MLGQEKNGNWLLSAYEKKGISASSSDIETEPGGKQNGTAPLQNSLSEGKDTANISDVQGNEGENEGAGVNYNAEENKIIRPIGKGAFGDIYDQFKGKPKEAIEFLKKRKAARLLVH